MTMRDQEIFVPYSKQGILGEIYAQSRVLSETYDDRGSKLMIRALPATIARFKQAL